MRTTQSISSIPPATPPCRTDRELLFAWRGGDASAGEALVRRHYLSIAKFFINKIGNGPDSEDLIQLTFLGCLESVDRFRGHASFRTFLFAIARHKLLQHLRSRGRCKIALNETWRSFAAELAGNVSVLVAREEQLRLLEAMRRLPEETQMMLELHYWEGMTIDEVARVLERPPNTVKTRMYRARQRIARELRAKDLGTPDAAFVTTSRVA